MAAKVTEKPKQEIIEQGDAKPKQEVAKFQAPRLPWHPAIEERFGIDKSGWTTITEVIWPAAKTTDAIVLALSYCRARHLDPFKRPIHIVPLYNKALKREVEGIWPGISELRTTAMRTNGYAGCDPCAFGPDIEKTFKNDDEKVTVTFPEWAQITLYRLVQGHRVPFPGPRVYWEETYATRGYFSEVPNDMWETRPRGQLEKVAEAAALRRAYPEELGSAYAAEEMAGRTIEGTATAAAPATPRPKREDFKAITVEAEEVVQRGPEPDATRPKVSVEAKVEPEIPASLRRAPALKSKAPPKQEPEPEELATDELAELLEVKKEFAAKIGDKASLQQFYEETWGIFDKAKREDLCKAWNDACDTLMDKFARPIPRG